jgi:transposase
MDIEMRVVGLDVAKNVFQIHGVDRQGETVLRKRLRRSQVAEFFRHQTRCLIGIEATQGAHYWARVLRALGHEVRLVAPQFVKPYLKSQKNDANDAEAICEAVSRPNMRFVPNKSIEQQDQQAVHRIRSRMIGSRTQLGVRFAAYLPSTALCFPFISARCAKRCPSSSKRTTHS